MFSMQNIVRMVSELPRFTREGEIPPSRTYLPSGSDQSSNPSYATDSDCNHRNKNIIPILYSDCCHRNKNIIPMGYSDCNHRNKNIIPIKQPRPECYVSGILCRGHRWIMAALRGVVSHFTLRQADIGHQKLHTTSGPANCVHLTPLKLNFILSCCVQL